MKLDTIPALVRAAQALLRGRDARAHGALRQALAETRAWCIGSDDSLVRRDEVAGTLFRALTQARREAKAQR